MCSFYGADQTEHNTRLIATLEHIDEAGVTLNEAKCVFSATSMKFLGHCFLGLLGFSLHLSMIDEEVCSDSLFSYL